MLKKFSKAKENLFNKGKHQQIKAYASVIQGVGQVLQPNQSHEGCRSKVVESSCLVRKAGEVRGLAQESLYGGPKRPLCEAE